MKSLILLSAAILVIILPSFAASTPTSHPAVKASEIFVPVGSTGKTISLLDLSRMSVKEFQAYTGKKLSFGDRLMFKATQRQLRNDINSDGTMNTKKMEKLLSKGTAVSAGFHLGGFLLGFLLSLIGVLIAYLISDGLKSSRVRWAWIGALIGLVVWGTILII